MAPPCSQEQFKKKIKLQDVTPAELITANNARIQHKLMSTGQLQAVTISPIIWGTQPRFASTQYMDLSLEL